VALTTYPHSLLGGAQDAIAVGRPLVLSDQPALREHFTGVAVFADNSAGGLLAAFRELEASEADLRAEVLARRERAPEAWAQRFAELDRIVAGARRRP